MLGLRALIVTLKTCALYNTKREAVKMPRKILNLTVCIALTLSAGAYASDDAVNMFNKEFQFIQENYATGYCLKLLDDPLLSEPVRRYLSLLAIQEVAVYATGGISLTGRSIGSLTSYKIGRKLNSHFVSFVEYAARPDIQKIIDADATEFSNAAEKEKELHKKEFEIWNNKIQSIKNSAKQPLATRTKEAADQESNKLLLSPLLCRIHEIMMLPQSEAALEFQEYAASVNRRALHKNMESFRQTLEDY